MVKRKEPGDSWGQDELAVPLPIQLFLWRQCSPFIRPKLGKLHEATCMFCQSGPSHHEIKEASKSLEKVLVQNILFGLSPSLTDAIRSVPRWRFVQAAFPHVMHCAATLLYNRRDGTNNLGAAETKLLYTLHWILLDAAEECGDSDNNKNSPNNVPFYYLFSVTSIQVFIYLFAPLLLALKESDFQNFRLENGLKIWGALWEYRHPDVPVFTTAVRPKRAILRGKRLQRSTTKFGDVFLGVGKSHGVSPEDDSVFFLGSGSSSVCPSQSRPYGPTYSECSSSTTDSKCIEATKLEEELRIATGPRDSFPETILEETSSAEEEHVVIFRLGSYTENDHFRDSQVYKAEHPSSLLRPPLVEVRDVTGVISSPIQSVSQPPSASISSPTDSQSARPGGTISPYKSSSFGSDGRGSPLQDPILATVLDVAVIRCLFVHQWTEEGVYWALMFIYRRIQRMQEIGHEVNQKETPRRRSNSLPVPKIQVSFHVDEADGRSKEYGEGSEHSSSDHNCGGAPRKERETGGSAKKKKKISDLKAFVETKFWSRSEKALEKLGREDSRRSSNSEDQGNEPGNNQWRVDRPHSAMEKAEAEIKTIGPLSPSNSLQGLIKGKSMPSLSSLDDEIPWLGFVGGSLENGYGDNEDTDGNKKCTIKVKRPIITVTQHTPSPSEACRDQVSENDSIENQGMMYYGSTQNQQYSVPEMSKLPSKPPLSRSQTDSNIQYPCTEIPEVPGTANFVTKDGFINLKVILKATNSIANRESHICSVRVCETILRLLDFLLDMGILKMNIKMNKISQEHKQDREKMVDSDSDSKHEDPVQFFINTLIRIATHLGCPHGCNDGQKGPPADFLRHTIQAILSRIYRSDQNGFKTSLRNFVANGNLREILDFYHAFVGFCVDPSSLLSPMSEWLTRLQDAKRPGSGRIVEGQQGGYATNFGASLGGAGTKGIEGQLVATCFKPLVTRFAKFHTQLKNPDNMAMYSDVRQLMCYVKEAHGGVFRRVALSGLIDSSDRPHKKVPTTQTKRIVKRVPYEHMRDSPPSHGESFDGGKSKKGLFKKKPTSSSITSAIKKAPSMSSVYDDQQDESSHGQSPVSTIRRRHHPMFPGRSVDNDNANSSNAGKRRIKKLVNWIRKTAGSEEIAGLSSLFGNEAAAQSNLPPTIARKFSQAHTSRPKLVAKHGARPMKQKLHIAKKKVEVKLGKISFAKKQKDTSSDDTPDLSRRNSDEVEGKAGPREANVVLVRDRRLIEYESVKLGMLRFSFLMETCQPGSVPDAQLAGAVLDLPGAPVIARAALLLEMSHFVHRCNSGAWPSWMKSSLPFYRPTGPTSRGTACARRMPALQRVAGKMFYAWADSISIRLEELFNEIGPSEEETNMSFDDVEIKRALRTKDEEEDFLDELNVNPSGGDCPMALRMIAIQLILEITSFLRETFPMLPKSGRMSARERTHVWPGQGNLGVGRDPHLRRWSVTLSSMGPPHASAQSLHSYGESQPSGDRKISFALHEADNESIASSNATLTSMQIADDERKKHIQGRGHFLKKSGSFKRRSYKLKRGQRDPDSDSIKRSDSIRSRRKVSAVSERSDTSEHMEHEISGEESPGVLSNEDLAESPGDVEVADEHLMNNFPWLKVIVRLFMSFNQKCTHQTFCHPLCYRRQMRACKRLTHAARKVYGEEFEEEEHTLYKHSEFGSTHKKYKKQGRKTSDQTHGSPIKRKDSIVKKDKMDKSVDITTVITKLGHHQHGSVMHLSKDTINTNGAEEEKPTNKTTAKKKKEDPHPMINYLKRTVMGLFHAQFSLVIKSIVVIPDDLLIEILPSVWEMLLEHDNELASTVAVIFILSGVKVPNLATNIINSQLTHQNPSIRLNAILRFQVLWRSRYQAWPRMEEAAHMTFKVPPHGIEFTLPSPKVGVESIPVVDPPWTPQVKTNVEEFTLDQIHHSSFLTANRTRRKIHAEMVRSALEAEESKRRNERENFYLSAVPVTIQAAYEPSLHHGVTDDHEEAVDDIEVDTSARQAALHHMILAQQLFPSCLCSVVLTIIHLLDDPAVTADGVAVYQTAEQVIWNCLVEDSALFLRFFLEKLTREKQDVMTRLLRRLIRFIPRLPSQAAFALFNYLVGYVMFYTRSPHEGAQEHTAAAMSILWMAVPSVHGILFKDLKQIFRKEQCDAALLLTANVPSAKKIIVHGPGGADAGGIPCQFPIQEDTQFSQIHSEAADFFGLSEDDTKYYYLVDHKTNQIHNMQSYVRDFYFFKRSQYPQLLLVKMETEAAFEALQMQAFMQKFLEIGKVLMTLAVLKRPDQVTQRVFFLHEELTKLPSFPRKALEADFTLYKGGSMDKEVRGLDQLHKYTWVLLIAKMFEGMASNLTYNTDLRIFISVINGALILHCEDSSMLRLCVATYINAATEFKNLFSSNGYMLIMPTMLRVYSNYHSNKMVCKTIETVVKQLYIIHRKPFILQMLGSIAPLLDTDDTALYGDANKIRGSRLFDLLHSLDRNHEDHLHILELVGVRKPLRAFDFCYHDESDNLSLLEVMDMCITVVAYAADSRRGHQMLVIIEAILSKTLLIMQKTTKRDLRQEKETIHHVAGAIRTLVLNSEPLAKNYNGPQLSGGGEGWGSNRGPYTKTTRSHNQTIDPDDDSHSKFVSESKRQPSNYQGDIEDPELLRQQFRQPRAMLLNIVAEFLMTCTARLNEISKKTGPLDTRPTDLLDTKCHLRLTEVAHSLLKMAPYDPATMGCAGLQRYMNDILPQPDWSHEDLRPALVNILRRLEKMFNKLFKKSTVRRITDWVAASNLLKGVYTTLCRHPYIAHLPHLKMLVQVCQSLVLGERLYDTDTAYTTDISAWSNSPPQDFCSVVVRMIAAQILALGGNHSLEQVCGGSSQLPSPEKTENLVVNLLLPLCLRVGCASKDSPKMRQCDISFAVMVILHAMNPSLAKLNQNNPNPPLKSGQLTKSAAPARSGQGSDPRSQSWSHHQLESRHLSKVKLGLLRVAFLGLKVMIVCFEKQLSKDWHRIMHCLRDMDARGDGGIPMWDFLDFCVVYRTALYLHIKPFIMLKLRKLSANESIKQFQLAIKPRLNTSSSGASVCKGVLIRTLGHQLKTLKEDMINSKIGQTEMRPSTMEIQTEVSVSTKKPKTSISDSRVQSPTKRKDSDQLSIHPRLFRKSSILRKRHSSSSLFSRQGPKEQESSNSGPTSVDGTEPIISENGNSGDKHRLHRQMAQSRKAFRFRKSRYGHDEGQGSSSPTETTNQLSPTAVPCTVSEASSTVVEIEPPLPPYRALQASLIPEEEISSTTRTFGSSSQAVRSHTVPIESDIRNPNFKETSNTKRYLDEYSKLESGLQKVDTVELEARGFNIQHPIESLYRDAPSRYKPSISSCDETSSFRSSCDSQYPSRKSSSSSKKEESIFIQDQSPLYPKEGAQSYFTSVHKSNLLQDTPLDKRQYPYYSKISIDKPTEKIGSMHSEAPKFKDERAKHKSSLRHTRSYREGSEVDQGKPKILVTERGTKIRKTGIVQSQLPTRHSIDIGGAPKNEKFGRRWSHHESSSGYQRSSSSAEETTEEFSPTIITAPGLPPGTKRFVVDKFTVTFAEKDEDTLI